MPSSPPPTTTEWVGDRLREFRCPQNLRRTLLTGIGARHRHDEYKPGERILYGPNNVPLRVQGYENGSVAVEHGDHRHALVRPRSVNYSFRQDPPPGLIRSILQSKR